MASLMENLIEVLEKESGEYENLLALSTRKTPAWSRLEKQVSPMLLAIM